MDIAAVPEFIQRSTDVAHHPQVPEIELHLATELTDLWQLTESSLGKLGIEPPFWAFPWPGSVALARFILDGGIPLEGVSLLDAACGSGLSAIAAQMRGARVVANDLDPIACVAARLNAVRNGCPIEVRCGDARMILPDFEIVLAGDVFYSREMAVLFSGWFLELARRGIAVFVAEPGRSYAPGDGYAVVAEYNVQTDVEVEGVGTKRTRILRVIS